MKKLILGLLLAAAGAAHAQVSAPMQSGPSGGGGTTLSGGTTNQVLLGPGSSPTFSGAPALSTLSLGTTLISGNVATFSGATGPLGLSNSGVLRLFNSNNASYGSIRNGGNGVLNFDADTNNIMILGSANGDDTVQFNGTNGTYTSINSLFDIHNKVGNKHAYVVSVSSQNFSTSLMSLDGLGKLQQAFLTSCATGTQTDGSGIFSACVASDQRLKKNIEDAKLALDLVDKLRPVTFYWKDAKTRDARQHTGFIAQEVEKVLPNAVVAAGKDLKGIDPLALNALLVAEIQDLRKRVAALESRK